MSAPGKKTIYGDRIEVPYPSKRKAFRVVDKQEHRGTLELRNEVGGWSDRVSAENFQGDWKVEAGEIVFTPNTSVASAATSGLNKSDVSVGYRYETEDHYYESSLVLRNQ